MLTHMVNIGAKFRRNLSSKILRYCVTRENFSNLATTLAFDLWFRKIFNTGHLHVDYLWQILLKSFHKLQSYYGASREIGVSTDGQRTNGLSRRPNNISRWSSLLLAAEAKNIVWYDQLAWSESTVSKSMRTVLYAAVLIFKKQGTRILDVFKTFFHSSLAISGHTVITS